MVYRRNWLLYLLVFSSFFAAAQQSDTVKIEKDQILILKDSVFVPSRDTTLVLPQGVKYSIKKNQYAKSEKFYDSLKNVQYKNRLYKELYSVLFASKPPDEININEEPVKAESFFTAYEGKRITSITVKHVDIFEGDVNDTTRHLETNIGKLADDLHTETTDRVIQSHLLFNENDELDPYQLADSERIIRSLSYVEDARIMVQVKENLDEVGIVVIVKDRFSWGGTFKYSSPSKFRVGIINRNILGIGHQMQLDYVQNSGELPQSGYYSEYTARNIRKSFIDLTLFKSDNYELIGEGFLIERRFVSPEIKYGGALSYKNQTSYPDISFADSTLAERVPTTGKLLDAWFARSIQIAERNNIGLAIRYDRRQYSERPFVTPDSNQTYHNREFLLGSISYSSIKFLKTKNILSFNITEDVPIGLSQRLIFGKDWNEFNDSYYVGFESIASKYFSFGYLIGDLEFGVFVDQFTGERSNSVYQIAGGYFSPLIKSGRSTIRNFIRANLRNGTNLSIPTSFVLDNDQVRNIKGEEISGNRVFNASVESVMFTQWYWYGFRFAPFIFSDFGLVKENRALQPYSNIYYGIGSGLRIRNESLVFNTLSIRFVVFPKYPPGGESFAFEISFNQPTLFRNLSIIKPRLVVFN